MGIYVVRAFVRLHALVAAQQDWASRLDDLEQKTEALALRHDVLDRNSRAQFKRVFAALRKLMTPPDPPKRPIGFVTPEDKKPPKSAGAGRARKSV